MNDNMTAPTASANADPGAAVDRIALVVVKILGVLAVLGFLAYLALSYAASAFANWEFVY